MTVISLSLTLASTDCRLHGVILGSVDWQVLRVSVCLCVLVRLCALPLFCEPELASQFRKLVVPAESDSCHFVHVVNIMNIDVSPCDCAKV